MMIDVKEHSQKLKDIVITSVVNRGGKYICSGTLLDEWYKTILLELDEERHLLWEKTFGDDHVDYEGQDLLYVDEGYLICGGSEGVASESGGQDWKGYILKTGENGDKKLYRTYNISGNDVFWSMVEGDDGFILLGEASDRYSKKIFVLKVDRDGNKVWEKELVSGKKVFTGGIAKTEKGYIITGSTKQGEEWKNVLFKIDEHGKILWERSLDCGMTYDICSLDNQIYLTGSKHDSFNVTCLDKKGKLNWERSFSKGRGLRIISSNGSIIIGGDIELGESQNPTLCQLNSQGEVKWKQDYDYEGWIETFVKTKKGYLLFIFGLEPSDHTILMHVNNDGVPIG